VLAVGPLAQITSMVRSMMLDELGKPYVSFSQAVGMPSFLINYKYALRNAFSSTLTLIGFLFPLMIGGAFVVEKVFAWPGIARFGADSILANDYNAIVGVTLVVCLFGRGRELHHRRALCPRSIRASGWSASRWR